MNVTISIVREPPGITITNRLDSWGGGVHALTNFRVEDGVLLPSGPSIGSQAPTALFAITLSVVVVAPPQ